MKRRFTVILFSMMAIIVFSFPQLSSAAPDIAIEANAGFDNKVKFERGFPVQLRITNSGTAFSGDVVLNYSESYNMGAGLAVPLELAAGESKTIQIALPGMTQHSYVGSTPPQSIFLYEGGWEDGESIDFEGAKNLQPSSFGPTSLFLATLTDNQDRLLQIGQISPAGSDSTHVFHLNQSEGMGVPGNAMAWDSIDTLIIDEFSYSDLSAPEQEAIFQWLQQGGNILVGSSDNLSASMGNLSEYLPLELGAQQEISVPSLENPVPGFDAELKDGAAVLMESEEQIQAAVRNVGAGTITQIAFSIGDETVSDQEGYTDFMAGFILSNINSMNAAQGESIKNRMAYEIGSSNELFESFKVSKTLIFVIILLYIILIVPVLYTVLNKKDKREYAWIIIPAVAIITSIALFAAGAKDRIASSQIQQTGFFEADEDGGLSGYYMNSLLSNRGGDYQFSASDSTNMTPQVNAQFSGENPHMSAILEKGASGSSLTIRDMRYWSVASILGESYIPDTGNFDIQLEMNNNTLTGTIINNFPFTIEDAAVWTGTRLLALGSLDPGEEVAVNESVQSNVLPAISPVRQNVNFQPGTKEELLEARKQGALAMSYEALSENGSSAYLIGYTNDAIVPITLDNKRASVSSVHLLAQSFEPAVDLEGEISIDSDSFGIELAGMTPNAYFEEFPDNPHRYALEEGEYKLTYQLPQGITSQNTTWDEMEISPTDLGEQFSIFNIRSKDYEKLEKENTFNGNIENYLSEDGKIELKVSKDQQMGYSETIMPKIELKGVVAP